MPPCTMSGVLKSNSLKHPPPRPEQSSSALPVHKPFCLGGKKKGAFYRHSENPSFLEEAGTYECLPKLGLGCISHFHYAGWARLPSRT